MKKCCHTLSEDIVKKVEDLAGFDCDNNKLVYILAFDSNNQITAITRDGFKIEPLDLPIENTNLLSISGASFGSFTGSHCFWATIDGERVKIC